MTYSLVHIHLDFEHINFVKSSRINAKALYMYLKIEHLNAKKPKGQNHYLSPKVKADIPRVLWYIYLIQSAIVNLSY